MKTNTQHETTAASTIPNLSKLEALFDLKISPLNLFGFFKSARNLIGTISTEHEPVAFLIETDRYQTAPGKLWFFLYASLKFKYFKFRLSRLPSTRLISYGIYPLVEAPFAIYQLGTTAETYANANILPALDQGIKGRILQILNFIAQYHTSTAGIVILIHKK